MAIGQSPLVLVCSKRSVSARWRRAFLEAEREKFENLVQAFSSGNVCLFAPGPVLGLTRDL